MTASPSANVKEVNLADFVQEVLERSETLPVVVDFWAPWCAPCRMLGPIIEQQVEALGGRVALAKVNTDENPELAQEFGIQGIPAVKAFRNGKVVSEFVGAIPAAQIQKFLKDLASAPGATALEQAEAAARAGQVAEAETQLRGLTNDAEVGNRARLALAGLLVDAGRAAEAKAEFGQIDPRSTEALAIPGLERRLDFANDAVAYGGEAAARAALAKDPNDLDARFALASALAARGEFREALENFLELVTRNRKFKDDAGRIAMLSIFERLGSGDDLVREFRRRLQIVL